MIVKCTTSVFIDLYQLIGRGCFRSIGLPLKIRGGNGSTGRAIAVFEE